MSCGILRVEVINMSDCPEREINPPEPGKCFRCDGEGWITCPECGGSGLANKYYDEPCNECNGEREIQCLYCR